MSLRPLLTFEAHMQNADMSLFILATHRPQPVDFSLCSLSSFVRHHARLSHNPPCLAVAIPNTCRTFPTHAQACLLVSAQTKGEMESLARSTSMLFPTPVALGTTTAAAPTPAAV